METVFFYENKKTWKLYFSMKTRKKDIKIDMMCVLPNIFLFILCIRYC